MAILLLILQILSFIPSLIKTVEEIIKLIQGQSLHERAHLLRDLTVILSKHHAMQCADPEACEKDLQDFKDHLVNKYS